MAIFHRYNARQDCFEPVWMPPDFMGEYRPKMFQTVSAEVRAKFVSARRRKATQIVWTPERDAALRSHYEAGMTYDAMAVTMEMSRSAVHNRLMALADMGLLMLRMKR